MSIDTIELEDHELEVVYSVMKNNNMAIDKSIRKFSLEDLNKIGIYRESYSIHELRANGFDLTGVVSSFDKVAKDAETLLSVDAPFATGIKKWQLPIDVEGFRIITTEFPPNTTVLPHIHSMLDKESKSGGFRMVIEGSITFEEKKYLPGDWFFIPNGVPYSFTTDPDVKTKENYWYGHNLAGKHTRISSPQSQNP